MMETREQVAARIAGPPPSPAVPEMIQAVVEFERCGRWIAAALALDKLRRRYDEFRPVDLPADERTWGAFAAKHIRLDPARVSELLRRMGWPDEGGETLLERAMTAIRADPARSNRTIAREIGVSEPTVRRARREVAKRAGHDALGDAPDARVRR